MRNIGDQVATIAIVTFIATVLGVVSGSDVHQLCRFMLGMLLIQLLGLFIWTWIGKLRSKFKR